jgi:hypothetical protein
MLDSRLAGPMIRFMLVASALTLAACGGEGALAVRDGSTGLGGHGGSTDSGSGDRAPDSAGGGAAGTDGGSGGTGTGGAAGAGTDGGTDRGPAMDGGGDAAPDAPVGAANGTACTTGSQCQSAHCAAVDKVCCDTDCAGVCNTCTATLGTCTPTAVNTDPHNDCTDQLQPSCGNTGMCNGAGACQKYASGLVCSTVPVCNSTNSSIVISSVCNGLGMCVPGMQTDCKGFLCANATCGTSCTSDSNCTSTSFCSAGACVQSPANLAGNGDLEYGTTAGWAPFCGGALFLSNTTASGIAHLGQYSTGVSGRSKLCDGPSYALPTGPGRYVISAWGLQRLDASMNAALQSKVTCNTASTYPTVGNFGTAMAQGIWTRFTGTIDTSTAPDCLPTGAAPGLVKTSTLYLNQTDSPLTTFPDLFLDDLVVQVTDGHNLVGNPNFESALPDGWNVNGGGSLTVSSTIYHGTGAHSLGLTGRTTTASGPMYPLPIGAAKYNLSVFALHTGTAPHSLTLQPTYTCVGGTQTLVPPVASATVASGIWTQLSGTVTLPPANAVAGCRLTQAGFYVQQESGTCSTGGGTIECPDVYIDDVSVTLPP